MRRIIFFMVAIFFFSIGCFAQNENRIRQFRNNIASSDEAIQHPRRGNDVGTWMTRGKLFYDAYNVNIGYLRIGMSPVEARLYFREPREVIEEDGLEVFVYNQIRLFFDNGSLIKWDETGGVVENALAESMKAYDRARSLDARGRNTTRIADAFRLIGDDLEGKFFNEYQLLRFKDALNTALLRIELGNLIDVPDMVYHFFAGYMAMAQSEIDGSLWQEAIDFMEKAIELGFEDEGQIYSLLYNAYLSLENEERALSYAQTGFQKHPGYTHLMYDLINFYLEREQNEQALEYLEYAISNDPQNAVLLFAKGKVLDELGELEKSLLAYQASIALDPEYFDPYFNISVLHYNQGVKFNELANDARTQADYDMYRNQSDEEFEKAIPPMEKAFQLKPDEIATVETLRTLYFRLRTKFPEFEEKYNEMVRLMEEAEAQ